VETTQSVSEKILEGRKDFSGGWRESQVGGPDRNRKVTNNLSFLELRGTILRNKWLADGNLARKRGFLEGGGEPAMKLRDALSTLRVWRAQKLEN